LNLFKETSVKNERAEISDIEQVKDDIAALKRDLALLISTMTSAAVDGSGAAVRESAEQLSEGARVLYEKVAAQGDRTVKAVGQQIEAQPVLSLLVAFGVGFCASRLLSR
jgi:ElaB/YqjD/DUF883 family membrane-anchored ribosome-binding protein